MSGSSHTPSAEVPFRPYLRTHAHSHSSTSRKYTHLAETLSPALRDRYFAHFAEQHHYENSLLSLIKKGSLGEVSLEKAQIDDVSALHPASFACIHDPELQYSALSKISINDFFWATEVGFAGTKRLGNLKQFLLTYAKSPEIVKEILDRKPLPLAQREVSNREFGDSSRGRVTHLKQIHHTEFISTKKDLVRIGTVQAKILEELLTSGIRHVFSESLLVNLSAEDPLHREKVLEYYKSTEPDINFDTLLDLFRPPLPIKLSEDQLAYLGLVGAPPIAALLDERISLYATSSTSQHEKYRQWSRRAPRMRSFLALHHRQRIAGSHINSFFKVSRGDEAALVYGAMHTFAPHDFRFSPPAFSELQWPASTQEALWYMDANIHLALEKLKKKPEIQEAIVQHCTAVPHEAFKHLVTKRSQLYSITKLTAPPFWKGPYGVRGLTSSFDEVKKELRALKERKVLPCE